jgi:hypothetical protein
MGVLAKVDLDMLPREPVYRPIERQAWYSRSLPLAVGVGAGIGLLSTYLSPFIIWAGLAGVFGWVMRRRQRMVRMLRDNDDGVALLVAGDLDDAIGVFDRLCRHSRFMPGLHSLFVFNRAVAHLERGEHDRAAALLSAVLHAGWVGPSGALAAYYPAVLGRLALVEALRGRLDVAEAWRARAHATTSAAKRGSLLLVDAVVEARHEAWDRVIDLIDEGWGRAQNLLTARAQRAVRLMHALALEQVQGSDYRMESRDQDRRRALDAVRDGRVEDVAWLVPGWPTLAQFLERHGLRVPEDLAHLA